MKLPKVSGRNQLLTACFLFVGVSLAAAAATNEIDKDSKRFSDPRSPPKVDLRHVEAINLEPQPPVSKDEEAHILKLIKNLAKIKSPYFGLSPTLSGEAFAPIPETEHMTSGLLTYHQIVQTTDFLELVKLGPKALPYLLKALDDQTQTKMVVTHDGALGFGTMYFDRELDGNPANETELKILTSQSQTRSGIANAQLETYVIKVGDVCYVIVGEITARAYQAARYQPTACIVVNSPTHDTNLAQQVRAVWASDNPAQHLLDSYLFDFASRGDSYSWTHGDFWRRSHSLETGAATRLLYYYPKETTNLIVTRLRSLDVGKSDVTKYESNEVSAVDLIKAVAWSHEPAVQAELRRIFEITTDPEILVATAGAKDASSADAFRKRLEEFISKLPETEEGPYGDGYELLVALGREFGPESRPAFENYMAHASLQRRRSMCRVLEKVHGGWSVDLLGPLLKDKRPAEGWHYAVVPGQNEPRLPIRICDEAAGTIAKNFSKLKFKMAGSHRDLDIQILTMREQIAHHDY